MSLKYFYPFIFIFTFLFYSCDADVDIHNISGEVSLRPDLIIPLGGANLTIGEMLKNYFPNGKIQAANDSNEVIYISEDSAEFTYRDINFLNNINQISRTYFPSPATAIVLQPNENMPVMKSVETFNLGINEDSADDKFDSIKVSSAIVNLTFNVSSDLTNIDPSHFRIKLTFPPENFRFENGTQNSLTFTPANFGQPLSLELNNFVLSTANKSEYPVYVTVESTTGDIPIVLTQNSSYTCNFNFSRFDFSVAYGRFSYRKISSVILRNINLGNALPNGILKLANPQVKINVLSNIGSYLSFYIDYIKAYETESNVDYAWFDNHTTNSATFSLGIKPTLPGHWISKDIPTLNKDYGETNQLFEDSVKPNYVEYKFSASIDSVLTKQDPTPQFITPDAKIKLKISTTIPFYLNSGSYYEFNDTIQNIFKTVAETIDKLPKNTIDTVALVLNVKNGLPVSTNLKINLLDSIGNTINTDFIKEYTIKSGIVDVYGTVLSGKESNQLITIQVSGNQLNELKKAHAIAYVVRLNGEDLNSKIHLKSTNTFNLKAGLFVSTKISTNVAK
jgi:hypothetical protein